MAATQPEDFVMTTNVGGIDRVLRIVVGHRGACAVLRARRQCALLGARRPRAAVHRAVPHLPALFGHRGQYLPDEEGRLSQRAGHPAHECLGAHGAGLPGDFATALEHDQRRDAADAVAAGDVLGLVGVELGEPRAEAPAAARLPRTPAPSSGTGRTTAPRNRRPPAGRSSRRAGRNWRSSAPPDGLRTAPCGTAGTSGRRRGARRAHRRCRRSPGR